MAGENTQEATDRISLLQDEISRLEQHEKMLDQHKLVSYEVNSDQLSGPTLYSVGSAEYQEHLGGCHQLPARLHHTQRHLLRLPWRNLTRCTGERREELESFLI